ncbi:MAG TPA: ubiquinol-cytochrome C chaperone family protein [Sphingobium sp.]|nr:ubiquinol-cytochrome C chaperone family protein [Sphingobium sp.]
MSLLSRLFARHDDGAALRPLYAAAVARARAPHWYLEGGVADTIDGRFDMIAAVLSVILLRLEALDARTESARLTELFIEDMDGQIRQIGFGDVVVGKQIGHMVGALGGRLAAYRTAFAGEASLDEALRRNLYRGGEPAAAQLAHVTAQLRAFAAMLATRDLAGLLAAQFDS